MDSKDLKRLQDIRLKAFGSTEKAVQLATNMANKITKIDKCIGRTEAAVEVFGPDSPVTQAFEKRTTELQLQQPEYTIDAPKKAVKPAATVTPENDTTDDKTLYLPTASAVALWDWEFSGQISDGMWENTRPYDHWKVWCHLKTKIGEPRFKTDEYVMKNNYNFGALKQYVGDRMLAYGRFGKAVGDDILTMGGEVRCTVEDFPKEGPFNLEEFKAQQIARYSHREAEYYWKGLEQKHVDAFYETVYTNKELSEDIKQTRIAIKNRIY